MTSAYFAPLVLLPTVIDGPGVYETRAGETVVIHDSSPRHCFGCCGTYASGVAESWHRSGRVFASRETQNDIVKKHGGLTKV